MMLEATKTPRTGDDSERYPVGSVVRYPVDNGIRSTAFLGRRESEKQQRSEIDQHKEDNPNERKPLFEAGNARLSAGKETQKGRADAIYVATEQLARNKNSISLSTSIGFVAAGDSDETEPQECCRSNQTSAKGSKQEKKEKHNMVEHLRKTKDIKQTGDTMVADVGSD
ncbi:Ig domain-containing protein [Anopheles sinensis]|uniref:Ig domain-containing protein n=1 Tax=Anopheles sinensis TaxID=74873 RepID=A0A084WC11_ANOSI|nr:Ig domain-containing protein [Anopheles sinensis]